MDVKDVIAPIPLYKPELYRPVTGSGPNDPVDLVGGICDRCGYVFFPPKSYGCERCGSVALSKVMLAGRGVLAASTDVYLHTGPGREPPFVVGTIALDAGPVVRTLITSGPRQRGGSRVIAVLIPVDVDGARFMDLRFTAEG